MIEVDALIADTDGEIAEALGNEPGMGGTSTATAHTRENTISIEGFFQGPFATFIIKYVWTLSKFFILLLLFLVPPKYKSPLSPILEITTKKTTDLVFSSW